MTEAAPSATVPAPRPLAHPRQDLGARFRDDAAPRPVRDAAAAYWRALVFLPAALATGALLWGFLAWFATDGTTWAEGLLAVLIGVGFFWIALTFVTVVGGAISMGRRLAPETGVVAPLDVALLMPVYEEAPWDVFGNAAAMLEALARRSGPHRYALYILSDTRDPDRAAQEEAAYDALRARLPSASIWYRRRAQNTDRKVGNLAQWVETWGGGHDAMLVLDADSLMSAHAIGALSDALSRDPGAGLIQSFPQLIGARTLFARSQQFANAIYGVALAEGLARWTGREGNYWGHNAIIRIAAFASSAGLPRIRGLRGRDQLILSHDFVEAGLLRRAGWSVRFLPRVQGSYEETPPSLIDHALRDRRWCRGNLQHLGLLGTRGFHALSRFHLFHGAVGYLLSPLWFILLTIWAAIGVSEDRSVINYFSPENPTLPNWPEMSPVNHVWLMVVLYGLLLAPKLIGAAALVLTGTPLARLGGAGRFGTSLVVEIAMSIAYAPILMVQQTRAVAESLLGIGLDWTPQSRSGGRYSWWILLRFHWVETTIGALLAVGMGSGYVSPWLIPVMVSLLLAVPLSRLSAWAVPGTLATPQEVRAPLVATRAAAWRQELRDVLGAGRLPAE
ncbi:glucans biosynthesis glucosyltransferase H [Jannaschia pagri]|uniref:Glucans biosynthesis glucosyltransferase H n=1 Tax=Jannaschia pagri TaxID=2829797 RepID=A0ABQ4NN83_9RHOB|nr:MULTISPECIES: glucans biosynthesis glucosyltransferase MdoH [unclassified Jannaschia]GIT92026.1 glucans biosynthesis glucosyltransferase H [Jannaschia sp. AI_61]GIT95860.1 glucans biosynthesis glucosyltransferase H [Jannaschia sp. AI_62]